MHLDASHDERHHVFTEGEEEGFKHGVNPIFSNLSIFSTITIVSKTWVNPRILPLTPPIFQIS